MPPGKNKMFSLKITPCTRLKVEVTFYGYKNRKDSF